MAGESVILVESNEKIIQQFAEPFRKMGYKLSTVQWAEEALNIIQQGGIDAVISRTKLPGMSSFQFAQNLRRDQRFQNRPIIIIYGKDDIDIKLQSFKSGADDYLVLPFPMPELFFRLEVRLKKTLPNDPGLAFESDTLSIELQLPAALPKNGQLASRSVPSLMGVIYQRGSTGTLRIIEKRNFRAFYFENGLLRGAKSIKTFEKFSRRIEFWRVLNKEDKQRTRAVSKTSSDADVGSFMAKMLNASQEKLNALTARYIEFISRKALRMKSADYDWMDNDNPRDMMLMTGPGIHPLFVLLPALRKMLFPPSYKLHQPKGNYWIIPSKRAGKAGESARLTATEQSFLDYIGRGRTVAEILDEGHQMLPYAEQFLHMALCFDVLTATDRKPAAIREKEPAPASATASVAEVLDGDTDEFRSIRLEDIDDEIKPVAPRREPEADETPIGRGDSSKSPPTLVAPKKMPPLAASKPADLRETPVRKVRELFPARTESEQPLEVTGIKAVSINPDDLKSGSLSKMPFAFISALAIEAKKTGVMKIQPQKYLTKLYWRRGKLIFSRTDDPAFRIDQVMMDMKMITAEQRSKVEDMISEMGKMRSGTIIFKSNLVNMFQLSEALSRQTELILSELFNLTDGTYEFAEGDLPESEHIPMDLAVENLFLDGMRSIKNTEIFAAYLPDLTVQYEQTGYAKENLNRMNLGPTTTSVIEKFRHAAQVKEAVAGAEISLKEFKLTILGCLLLGLLKHLKN